MRRDLSMGWRFLFIYFLLIALTRLFRAFQAVVYWKDQTAADAFRMASISGDLMFLAMAIYLAWKIAHDDASRLAIGLFAGFLVAFDLLAWTYTAAEMTIIHFAFIFVSIGVAVLSALLKAQSPPTPDGT